jgi:hypothetical protein
MSLKRKRNEKNEVQYESYLAEYAKSSFHDCEYCDSRIMENTVKFGYLYHETKVINIKYKMCIYLMKLL